MLHTSWGHKAVLLDQSCAEMCRTKHLKTLRQFMHIAVAFYWLTVNEVTIEEFGNMALMIVEHNESTKFNLIIETHEETEVLC